LEIKKVELAKHKLPTIVHNQKVFITFVPKIQLLDIDLLWKSLMKRRAAR